MRDVDLYAKILGIEIPWQVVDVELRLEAGEVEVYVEHSSPSELLCPECGTRSRRYDTRRRRWRHLPTCQFKTVVSAEVPRADCPEHGVKTIRVPWSVPGSGFTALFEALVIDWLHEASIQGVARRLELTWDQVDGVLQRAVKRGLLRRDRVVPRHLGVDETSFQKRHEYVTVIADRLRGVVQQIGDGHSRWALEEYYRGLSPAEAAGIESITMDMWLPYIRATESALPDGSAKIAFDKFHVAQHLNQAVDKVRQAENRALRKQDDGTLVGTKHLWLFHPDHLSAAQNLLIESLVKKALKTSRAWMLKQLAMEMWNVADPEQARVIFERFYTWAVRSRLEPMKRSARMIKRHLRGILNAIRLGITNARLEGMNSVIQWLKRSARGFRNRERFRNAIYFHLGGLDLYPDPIHHSNS